MGMWVPNDVEMVSKALDAILNNPHLSKEQLTAAQQVATKVKQSLTEVTTQKLKGEARRKVVGEAIAALTGLQTQFEKNAADAKAKDEASEHHLEDLEKEMEAKKALLAKDEDQIKVLDLEKELAEKKLKLDTLMEKKQAAAAKKTADEEKHDREELFTAMEAMTGHDANASAKTSLLARLDARMKKVNAAIANIDADEKAAAEKIDGVKTNGDAKMAKMFKQLRKEEHRKFAKSKSIKTRELTDLKKADESAEKNDADGVKAALSKLKNDAKTNDAKSGNFLH